MRKVVIVGGGISGLSFAAYCANAGMYVTVIEKAPIAGGCIATKRIDGYPVELGANTCYNSYGNFLFLCEMFGLNKSIKEKRRLKYRVYSEGAIISVLKRFSVLSLVLNLPNAFTAKRAGKSVKEFFSQVLGKKNYTRLFHYFMQAVMCQDADQFPAEMVFRKKPRNKNYPKVISFKSGLGSVVDALSGSEQCDIRYDVSAQEIESVGDGYKVHCDDGGVFDADVVVTAVPPYVAAQLWNGVNKSVSSALNTMQSVSVESMAVSVPRIGFSFPEYAGMVGVDQPFYSMMSADSSLDEESKVRAFTFHFQPGVASREGKISQIAAILGIAEDGIQSVIEKTSELPTFKSNHLEAVAKINASLTATQYCLGNYFIGSSIEDCCQRSRDEFMRLLAHLKG